jgi:hypothetical protein
MHAEYLRIQTHTHYIQYLLLFNGSNSFRERAPVSRYTYIACLVSVWCFMFWLQVLRRIVFYFVSSKHVTYIYIYLYTHVYISQIAGLSRLLWAGLGNEPPLPCAYGKLSSEQKTHELGSTNCNTFCDLLVDHPAGGLIANAYSGSARNNDALGGWFSQF